MKTADIIGWSLMVCSIIIPLFIKDKELRYNIHIVIQAFAFGIFLGSNI